MNRTQNSPQKIVIVAQKCCSAKMVEKNSGAMVYMFGQGLNLLRPVQPLQCRIEISPGQIIKRPGVAGAVLQTALSLSH